MEDRPTIPPSLIEMAIEPRPWADRDRLLAALARLAHEDPALHFMVDSEAGQIVICGVSEHHLESKIEALRTGDRLGVKIGAPQIAYRETISEAVTIDYTYKKFTGASGQFARVVIAFEPSDIAEGFTFENASSDASVPAHFVPGVEKGLRLQSEAGLLAGFPLIGVKARLLDGAYHDMDSNVFTFEIAARAALRELALKAHPLLLQPMMTLEVTTPDEYLGAVIHDIGLRGGSVLGQNARGDEQVVIATVALAGMFGYANALRALSQGRARHTMVFDRYAQLPVNMTDPDDPTFTPAAGARPARYEIT